MILDFIRAQEGRDDVTNYADVRFADMELLAAERQNVDMKV